MNHYTQFCPASYSAMQHPDFGDLADDLSDADDFTEAELLDMADNDGFEKYQAILPYNEWEWDRVNHQECDSSYGAALIDLFKRDMGVAYAYESHVISEELEQYARDLIRAREELFAVEEAA